MEILRALGFSLIGMSLLIFLSMLLSWLDNRRNPELKKPSTKTIDPILMLALLFGFIGMLIVIPLTLY